jgi:outer membrane biosynthesis protein TonB
MSGRRIGNYLISDYLGGGGFGTVFKAEDTSTPGRIVAIKELHKKHTRSAVIKQRFFQEAVAMARLDHANLPRLYSFGEDNGSYYLVMEFLSGKLLTDEIRDKGQLPIGQALTIITQVLEAVSYAHRNGIIHRDLKPDNIMLTSDANNAKVKVLDFGIARMVGGENLTMAGEGFGTPTYMAPERINGSTDPDNRSDVYSLGIILYEMLAGKAPFSSSATDPLLYWSEMRSMHETQPLPPLGSLGISAEIERVITKATAKAAASRYATADEMLADLLPASEQGAQSAAKATGNLAQLFLTTVPPAAEVYVDDALRGASDAANGKLFIDALPPGTHNVRVSKTGYNEYSINVVLEEGKRTELQVPLAARSTVMMAQVLEPTVAKPGEPTSPMDAKTVRMESGDEVATAMLMLEGVPAGSQIFVGSQALALAGDDGRATIKLEPGIHELQVRTPTGETGKRLVTLTQEDTGSYKTLAMPFTTGESPLKTTGPQVAADTAKAPVVIPSTGPATVAMGSKSAPDPAATKKRVAMAVAAVLLLALVASAYFVLRKPNVNSAGDVVTNITTPNPAPTPPADNQPNQSAATTDAAKTDAEREAMDREKAQLEREKKALEKKEQEIAEKNTQGGQEKPQPAAPSPAQPATPTPPANSQGQAEAGTGCVGARILGPDGEPLQGVRVMFTGSTGVQMKRTGPNGMCNVCGLAVGSSVKIMALAGGPPETRDVTVRPGQSGTEIRLNRPLRMGPGGRPGQMPSPDEDFNRPDLKRERKLLRKRPNMQ